MTRFAKFYIYILWCLLTVTGAKASGKTVVEDFDSLSRLSSAQLMESGRQYFEQRQASKALACFTIVGERAKEGAPTDEVHLSIRALNNSACVYKFFYFDYIQAYECFSRAYDLCERVGYDEFMPAIMVNMGDLLNDYGLSYGSQALTRQAQDIFEQCMERAKENRDWELMTTAFFNLSNQNYTLPLEKYRIIFTDEIPDSTPDLRFVRLQYQGLEKLQQGRYSEARTFFEQQLKAVSARWEPTRDTLAAYMSIAHCYRMESDYAHEADFLEKALAMATEAHVGDQATGICNLLAECYAHQGDTAMQQRYRQLYLEKKEETHAHRLVSIGELNYIHELKKEEARAQQLAERQERQQLLLLAGALLLAVVLVASVLLWQKYRQLQARNKSLYEKNRLLLQAEQEARQLRRDYEQRIAALTESAQAAQAAHPEPSPAANEGVGEGAQPDATPPTAPAEGDTKYSRSSLSDEQKDSLIYRIQEILNNPDIICQQDFTLSKLARQADSNTTYVSQVINERYGTAFSNVLSGFRIKEACRRMNGESGHYSHVTIEAIATGVGFKSRTSFINAFKREVGLTPSEYLRMAQSKEA